MCQEFRVFQCNDVISLVLPAGSVNAGGRLGSAGKGFARLFFKSRNSSRVSGGNVVRPKVLATSATVDLGMC